MKLSGTDYNWHPAVHTSRFDEKLFFFLIRLREPLHRPVADQVRAVLAVANVRFACEYSVFGYWDAIVRAWLTPASNRRLINVLKRSESNVAQFRLFEATQIRYLWTGNESDLLVDDREILAAVKENERDIVYTVKNPTHDDPGIELNLRTAGLLIRRSPVNGQAVKFYMAFERTGGDVPIEMEAQALLAAITNTGLASRASLYAGVGAMADYLVRCVADTYTDVLKLSASLDVQLAGTHLRPMTLLVANSSPPESDNVNDLQRLSQSDEANMTLLDLGPDSGTRYESLTERDRNALSEFVRQAYEASQGEPDLRHKLQVLLRACLTNDYDELSSSLAFLLEFEWFLGEYLKPEWAAVYGPRPWIEGLLESLRRDPSLARSAEEAAKPIGEWTLGSYARLAGATATVSELFASRVERHLGPAWREQIAIVVPLRNEFAHGRLRRIDRLDAFGGDAQEWVGKLMDAATLYFRCKNAVAGGSTSKLEERLGPSVQQ